MLRFSSKDLTVAPKFPRICFGDRFGNRERSDQLVIDHDVAAACASADHISFDHLEACIKSY
jgi:hypothetical protein